MIIVDSRIAKITKRYSPYCWQIRFTDNGEYVNAFYFMEENWKIL